MKLSSYGKPLNLGHHDLYKLFDNPVLIQEKVDGSQISFGIVNGELSVRSRGQDVTNDLTGMFSKGVAEIRTFEHLLDEGVIYRGEYLQKPKHNTLAYRRVPKHHIILFDIEYGDGTFATFEGLEQEAERLDLECVPTLAYGMIKNDSATLLELLNQGSILGGCQIEGIVIKNYWQKDQHGKVLMGKLVSEDFRESHTGKEPKPKAVGDELVDSIMSGYNKEARWKKAVQHLTENGALLGEPKDIGPLLKEVSEDFEIECSDELKDLLYAHFRKDLLKQLAGGFAAWYKQYLAFGNNDETL